MLEKPDLDDDWIAGGLLRAYGVRAAAMEFLPVGADQATAAYRVSADGGAVYFLKLRRGAFDPSSVILPQFLRDQGIDAIIAPLLTATGQPWAELGADAMILYPYVEGRNGFEVDWDDPIMAPKERDLMFAGGAQGFAGRSPEEEEALFYRGYGPVEVDAAALAYYRYERIVVDIALFAEEIVSAEPTEAAQPTESAEVAEAGGEDRERSFRFLRSSFEPNGTIELAYRSDRSGRVPGGAAV
jgi:hypothetical protein